MLNARPLATKAGQFLNVSGLYLEWQYEIRLLTSGYLGAQWLARSANFTVRWSNPLWDLAESSVEAEAEQILARLRSILNATPAGARRWHAWEEEDEPQVSTAVVHPVSARARFLGRRILLSLAQTMHWMLDWLAAVG